MEIIAVHPNLKESAKVTANSVMGQKLATPVNVARAITLKHAPKTKSPAKIIKVSITSLTNSNFHVKISQKYAVGYFERKLLKNVQNLTLKLGVSP